MDGGELHSSVISDADSQKHADEVISRLAWRCARHVKTFHTVYDVHHVCRGMDGWTHCMCQWKEAVFREA